MKKRGRPKKKTSESYLVGEEVECKYENVWYRARIMRRTNGRNGWSYKVHYIGWGAQWNETVPSRRLRKPPSKAKSGRKPTVKSTVARLKMLIKTHVSAPNTRIPKLKERTVTGRRSRRGRTSDFQEEKPSKATGQRGRGRKNSKGQAKNASTTKGSKKQADNAADQKGRKKQTKEEPVQKNVKKEAKNEPAKTSEKEQAEEKDEKKKVFVVEDAYRKLVPKELIALLRLDHRWVKKDSYFPDVPVNPSVTKLLEEFARRSRQSEIDQMKLSSFVRNIKGLFNKSLPLRLLYRCERNQFEEISRTMPWAEYSDLFGCTHLVRFCASLGRIFKSAKISQSEFKALKPFLKAFLSFLNEKTQSLPTPVYGTVLPYQIREAYND